MMGEAAMVEQDEKLYEQAAREVLDKSVVHGLMAKAFTEANGDKDKTIALYIRLRVEQLREALAQEEPEPSPTFPTCGRCLYYYTDTGPTSLCKGLCAKHKRATLSHQSCPDFTPS
jgi:hypothetical protein